MTPAPTIGPGTHLGPYEIVSRLGAGGMGEVWRARDARLARDVAIKVLPADFARDSDRLLRFEREARITGALNHPHIVSVYDVGAEGGLPYVVTELLEGETLRARLSGGPLPVRKAVDWAVQVARGLAAAHARGVVHRDLKPENLFVTAEGHVKILDFGVAKATPSRPLPPDGRGTATADIGTGPGLVMGTVGYMSPEQVRGQEVDHRSDLFVFGAVLYEMLAGRRAFAGATAADTTSEILHGEPADIEGAVALPPALGRIVRRCLEKDPGARFQSAQDLAFSLESLGASAATSTGTVVLTPPRRRRARLIGTWLGALLLAGLGLALGLWLAPERHPVPTLRRLTFRQGNVLAARFAPDGQTVVFGGAWEGRPRELFSARVDGPEARPLGIVDAEVVSVSSAGELAVALAPRYDGNVALADGLLARVSLSGGAPRPVVEHAATADWSPDGSDLAVVRSAGGRTRLEYPVGRVLYECQGQLRYARASPDGEQVAFLEYPTTLLNGSLGVVDRQGRKRTLSESWHRPRGLSWSPDGREVWVTPSDTRGATPLYAVSLSGRARLVHRFPGWATVQDVSRDGRVLLVRENVYAPVTFGRRGQQAEERELSWLDGTRLRALSADGERVLITEGAADGSALGTIYMRSTDASPAVKLGRGDASDLSPDGRFVLALVGGARPQLSLIPTGPGEPRTLAHEGVEDFGWPACFFPDSQRVAVMAKGPGGTWRLLVQDLTTGAVSPAPGGELTRLWGVSPDGKTVAGQAADGRALLVPLDGGPARALPGIERGEQIRGWAGDGRSVYVSAAWGEQLAVVRVDLATGRREPWLELKATDPAGFLGLGAVRLTPDGMTYAYGHMRVLSDLYLAEGLR